MCRFLSRAAYGTLAVFFCATAALATINYSGVVNLSIPNTGTGLYVNVVDGTTYSGPNTFPTNPGPGANYDFNFFGTSSWSVFNPGSSGQSAPTPVPATSKGYLSSISTGPVSALNLGDPIGPLQAYNSGSPSAAALVTGSAQLFGFRFRHENVTSDPLDDTVHFGWGRVILTNGTPGTLVDYAWESVPQTGIGAGVVPEPASLGVLALAGIAALRRWHR